MTPRATPRLRVIAGILKGRRLLSPTWDGLRPTSDRLRETLFNVLGDALAGASVLDAYAGTGAVGIEALSRGASHVTFVERDPRAAALIRDNLARCGVRDGYTVLRADLETAPAWPAPFDLVFLDPPYADDPGDAVGRLAGAVAPGGRLVVEHAARRAVPAAVGPLALARTVTAGDSALSFYRAGTPETGTRHAHA